MLKALVLLGLLSLISVGLQVILVQKPIEKRKNRKTIITIYKIVYFSELTLFGIGLIILELGFIGFLYDKVYEVSCFVSSNTKIASYVSLTFALTFSAPILNGLLKYVKKKNYKEQRTDEIGVICNNDIQFTIYSLSYAFVNYIRANCDKIPFMGMVHIINLVLVIMANISQISGLDSDIKSTDIYMAIVTFYAIQKITDYFKKKYSNFWSMLEEKFFMTKEIDKEIHFDLNDLRTVIEALFDNYIETGKYVIPEKIREKYFKWSVKDEDTQHNGSEAEQEIREGLTYYSDRPIATNEEDLLRRKYFAELMAKALVNLSNKDTFTIGLYGRWGNGKTSLVNMTLKEIKKNQGKQENLIVVHFEPWNFSNTDQLLEQFFVRLTNVFRNSKDEKMRKVGEALEKYSDAFEIAEVIPYVGGLLSLFGKKGSEALGKKLKKGSDEKDILKQKENVINLLSQQEKRVLIVIDDIEIVD